MNLANSSDLLRNLPTLEEIEKEQTRRRYNMIEQYYQETGKLSRHAYPKHCLFFKAGVEHRERCMMAANRVGKTDAACFETTAHLTGIYPKWWEGRKFTRPIDTWLAGDTGTTVRDILQKKLFGEYHDVGTGFIPGSKITKTTNKSGVREAIDTAVIRHETNGRFDGYSTVVLKSYDQGRKSFQGGKPDIILLDEEPPQDVYTECLLRTMTNNGMIIMTFTPLMGMTELIYTYMEPEKEMVN